MITSCVKTEADEVEPWAETAVFIKSKLLCFKCLSLFVNWDLSRLTGSRNAAAASSMSSSGAETYRALQVPGLEKKRPDKVLKHFPPEKPVLKEFLRDYKSEFKKFHIQII